MIALLLIFACASAPDPGPAPELADVTAVELKGDPGAYTVSLTIRSPDVDCSQYADWWELLTEEGELIHRRILNHSHADEQPFTRSSESPVDLAADQVLIARAHLHPAGYGGAAMRGSAAQGFSEDASITAEFAAELEQAEPLPDGCWF